MVYGGVETSFDGMSEEKRARVLIVEDEAAMARALQMLLQTRGFQCAMADTGASALELISVQSPELVLLDLGLPDTDGLTLLSRIRETHPRVQVIVVTAQDSLATAIECIKAGAFHFIAKPYAGPELLSLIQRALEQVRLANEAQVLRERQSALERQLEMANAKLRPVFKSAAMCAIDALVKRVAPSDASVLLCGESGTGKEIIASRLHAESLRSERAFIRINCGAIAPNMLEAELFGYVRGAFTGATSHYDGVFQQANGGTLFLDEITELPPDSQTRLLRVLQEREFRPIGSAKLQQTDFRLICATNRSVEKALSEGRLREDLYYRVNTFQIEVPPLRDRGDDIPALVSHFIQRFGGRGANRVSGIDQDALETLCQHLWPGNVRELQNAIEHAAVIASGRITRSDLPLGIRQAVQMRQSSGGETGGMLFKAESMALKAALESSGGNKSTAAKMLGISRATLYAKVRQAGLDAAGKRGRPKKIS